jgi:MSHA biogenesis protein MshJ
MKALEPIALKLKPHFERLDQRTLRERLLIFGGGVVLLYMAWQTLIMDRLTTRARIAEQHLTEARTRMDAIRTGGLDITQNPAAVAAARNRALVTRLGALDVELGSAARGYVAPEHMTELLRDILANQHGLRLVSLKNLPAESLSAPVTTVGAPAAATGPVDGDRGPFLHPVELVVDGDYLAVVEYLHALEQLPFRMHWQRLELVTGDQATNRVRIIIGAFSLSRDWMTV